MKKIVALCVLIRALSAAAQGITDGYSLRDRYNDSLLIYTTFKSEVASLRQASDIQAWVDRQSHDADITANAFKRLKEFNKKDYAFTDEFTKESFGVAHMYPKPSSAFLGRQYCVTDYQTHFITNSEGRTIAPYILRYTFQESTLIETDKLDPVTGSPVGKPAGIITAALER